MVKKVVLVGLFIGGGYLFIKKILPKLNRKEFEADIKDYEVDRYRSNPTGCGGTIVEKQPKNTKPFSVLTMAGEGNDSSWDFDPYRDERQDNSKAIINGMVL